MNREDNPFAESPLKGELRKRCIRLWELRMILGGYPSEFKLSRVLNGIEPMHPELQTSIADVLNRYDEAAEIVDKQRLDQSRGENIEGQGGKSDSEDQSTTDNTSW